MKSGGAVWNIYKFSSLPSAIKISPRESLIAGRFIFTLMASLMSRRAIFRARLANYCWYLVYIWAGAAAAVARGAVAIFRLLRRAEKPFGYYGDAVNLGLFMHAVGRHFSRSRDLTPAAVADFF
jgi:hypothetical protein